MPIVVFKGTSLRGGEDRIKGLLKGIYGDLGGFEAIFTGAI